MSMGRFLFQGVDAPYIRHIFFFLQPFKDFQMNSTVKSYIWFLGFMAVTKLVVAPVAKQLNVPLVSDLLA
jgi:hypothetical protein